MKKIISVVMAVVMCVLTVSAGAAYTGFTVYCDPAKTSVSEDFLGELCVSLKIENNPGLWAARLFVVYPDDLSLADGEGNARVSNSGSVFPVGEAMTVGVPDLPLNDSRQPLEFRRLMTEKGIVKEGYRSVNIYFESDSLDANVNGDGTLATLYFSLTDSAVTGDIADIKLYYCKQDFVGLLSGGTVPSFKEYSPAAYGAQVTVEGCVHQITYVDRKEAGCTTQGYEKVICASCDKVLSESVITQKGHSYTTVVEDATCTKEGVKKKLCSVCGGDVTVLESYPKIPHSYKDTVVPPTKTEYGYDLHTCTECGDSYKDNYVDPDGIVGDVNLDGKVNAADANALKRIMSGTISATAVQKRVADLNGDGTVNAIDMNILSKYIIGYISSLG